MAPPPTLRLLFTAAALASFSPPATGSGIGFEFHHRFSDRIRWWAEAGGVPGGWGPEKGTAEYYSALAHHDRGRSLAAAASSQLAFVDGNATFRINPLGLYAPLCSLSLSLSLSLLSSSVWCWGIERWDFFFLAFFSPDRGLGFLLFSMESSLHYAIVALGTPNVTFLVALDTGSDLFWVPCDCRLCAPTTSPSYGNIEFDIYSPNTSSTSKKVSCSNSLCDIHNQTSCTGVADSCPYTVQYVSTNTSSSGVLVEDILYLTTEDTTPSIVEAPIVFGCGEIQTGSFLEGAAPNGLFGLGTEKTSVPSILASQGLVSNSFSMCFGKNGIGRINFGDKGSLDQQETPFLVDKSFPSYIINVTGIVVGNSSKSTSFSALVDSGTSFTYLADPVYTELAESFNAQVWDQRRSPDPNIPFEYCYDMSPSQGTITPPDINFTTAGGGIFPVNDPILVYYMQQNEYMYCLALNRSDGLNIIGQNFMTGLRLVFDREKMALGWKNFDCGKATETTKGGTNTTQVTNSLPPPSSTSKHITPAGAIFTLLLVLSLPVL